MYDYIIYIKLAEAVCQSIEVSFFFNEKFIMLNYLNILS